MRLPELEQDERRARHGLARQGWGRDYTRYSRGAYALQERQAREARRGIWHGEHVAPWEWRRGARLQVEQAVAPAGDCRIKGNISGSGRIYHLPGSRHYDRTRPTKMPVSGGSALRRRQNRRGGGRRGAEPPTRLAVQS